MEAPAYMAGCHSCHSPPAALSLVAAHTPEQEELPHKQLAERAVGPRLRSACDLHAAQHLHRGEGRQLPVERETRPGCAGWLLLVCCSHCWPHTKTLPLLLSGDVLTCSRGLQDSKNTLMAMPNRASLLAYTPAEQSSTAGVRAAVHLPAAVRHHGRKAEPHLPLRKRATATAVTSTKPSASMNAHLSRSRRCPPGGAPA